jgi:ABC-type glycerol-3-phosphate transport system substrate-binding protein
MKKTFVFLSAVVLALSACSDNKSNPSKDGEEQIPQPVENSGPNTEGQRAVEATVNDSTNPGTKRDTTNNPR